MTGARDDRLTQRQAAELLGLTYGSFRAMRARGDALPEPDGMLGNTPWWLRATIEDWLERVAS